jgi:hypothetical protein
MDIHPPPEDGNSIQNPYSSNHPNDSWQVQRQ